MTVGGRPGAPHLAHLTNTDQASRRRADLTEQVRKQWCVCAHLGTRTRRFNSETKRHDEARTNSTQESSRERRWGEGLQTVCMHAWTSALFPAGPPSRSHTARIQRPASRGVRKAQSATTTAGSGAHAPRSASNNGERRAAPRPRLEEDMSSIASGDNTGLSLSLSATVLSPHTV